MTVIEVEKDVTRLKENSSRLMADAELLVAHGRWGSAFALAVLGLEEVGKAILLKWSDGKKKQKKPFGKNFHVQKQLAVAHLLSAPVAIEHVIEIIAIPNISNLLSDKPVPDEQVEALAKKLSESKEGRWTLYVEIGAIDMLKQISIYDDGSKYMIEVRSSDVEAESVADIAERAKRALILLDRELPMKVARATYYSRADGGTPKY